MKAQICPICSGEGKYKNKECHGCGGKGWIEVREDYYPIVPYYPRPYEPYPYYRYPYAWIETYQKAIE